MPARAPAVGWPGWVTLAARLILGATLTVAGILKLLDLDQSVQSVRAYQLLPYPVTGLVGTTLPVIEIAVGVLLLAGAFTRVAAVIAGLLLLAFIAGIASVWFRGLSIDCGCFGSGGEVAAGRTQYPLEIARDVGLLLLAAWTAWRPAGPWAVDKWLFGSADPQPDPEE